jgi:YesN/AraC family two-component response regulator
MYKLIIIDDDVGTSNNLGSYFPWEEHGFCIAEKFYDGVSAFAYLMQHPVDLIISDIKMPEMNGIELARRLHELKRPELIIFISGYKDFDYAQKAIEYGVSYYCLKPVTYREIKDKLAAIRTTLDARAGRPGPLPSDACLRDVQMNKIKAYIRVNCRDASLASVASYMQMNQSYLSRLFREQAGENLSVYLTRIRMQQALALLQRDDYRTINEICAQVGYTNAVSFSKTFRKCFGVSPAAYRRDFNHPRLKDPDVPAQ